MTIRKTVYLFLSLFASITVFTAAFTYHYFRKVELFRKSSSQSQAELLAATGLRGAVKNVILESFQEVLGGESLSDFAKLKITDELVLANFGFYRKTILSDVDESHKGSEDRKQAEELREFEDLKISYAAISAELKRCLALRTAGKIRETKAGLKRMNEVLYEKDFLVKITRSTEAETSEIHRNGSEMEKTANELRWALIGIAVLELLKAAYLAVMLSTSILGRLSTLKDAIRKVHLGALEVSLPIRGDDEISSVFGALNRMSSDLKGANAELGASHERYRRIMESTSEGIWSIDEKMVTVYVNRQMAQMIGYEASEMVGKHLDTFMQERMKPVRDESIERQKATGGNRMEFEFTKKDGSPLHVMLVTNPLFNSDGSYQGATAMVTDISQLRRTEDQFRQAQKMEAIGQLAGGIAHDFNNILGVILMQADLLLDMDPKTETENYPAGIREIRDSAERAAALTRQLLVFSRKKKLEPQELNINSTIGEMAKMIRRLVGEDIKVVTELEDGLADVKVDPAQIQQVIMNLVVNARDAMPVGGNLTISTRRLELDAKNAEVYDVPAGPYVCLNITDSGCGMSAEVRKRIFEPFFTTKEVGKGTGLGLATVFGIVKQSGGYISVYSEPGNGSSFKVFFPRLAGAAQVQAPKISNAERFASAGSILLIEDEPALKRVTHDALVNHGYRVRTAENGADALRQYGKDLGQFDVVVTDVIMPEMNGPEFVLKIADACKDHGIKVLFLSGFSDGKLDAHGISSSSDNFMEKPYSMKALLRKVGDMVASGKVA